ncbi:aminopeptidase N [Hydrogenophilus islandicus]
MAAEEEQALWREEAEERAIAEVALEDYRPPAWRVVEVFLDFALAPTATEVTAILSCARTNGAAGEALQLDCDFSAVTLETLTAWPCDTATVVDFALQPKAGAEPVGEVRKGERSVTVSGALPDRLWVVAAVRLNPAANSALSGLYQSSSGLFTQCEPEGFRRIVPFIDRPDVLARYRVRLRAEKGRYPVLLSNGNLVATADLPDGWHYAVWDDPFPKPSYLFALVAADLVATEKRVVLADGRSALLQVWTAAHHRDRAGWALESLEAALRWDEQRFGRVLDLDRYMIVAVEDFNMGAMENKGLNLFNAKYVLVSPETASDTDYANVEAIVGHEYFHNWTGNRVTCRDWFQLTLKEGLTVFRDQEFSADRLAAMARHPVEARAARAVKRIEDVATLKAVQFPEDDGPMRHPVRPRRYRAIDNFYTATVYEKGAEVVRMLHTLLGEEGFRRGLDTYFARHDGSAVTCEDFVAALADANGRDLTPFLHWYDAAGTPEVVATIRWEGEALQLTLEERLAGWDVAAKPLVIPVRVGWIGKAGRPLPFVATAEGESEATPSAGDEESALLVLDRAVKRWRIGGIRREEDPVPSLLRGFSAPVRVRWAGEADGQEPIAWLLRRFAFDPDPFNRWQAGEALQLAAQPFVTEGEFAAEWGDDFCSAWQEALCDETLDPHFRVRLLAPPAEAIVRDEAARPLDPLLIRRRLMAWWRIVARIAPPEILFSLVARHTVTGPYRYEPRAAGSRALTAWLLKLLAIRSGEERTGELPAQVASLLEVRWQEANNLSDRLAVVDAALAHPDAAVAEKYLAAFAVRYEGDAIVSDKWLQRHATRWPWQGQGAEAILRRVQMLTEHPAFRWSNPNKVYALVLALFAHNLPVCVEAGELAWSWWREVVLRLDRSNPLVAARLARALEQAVHWCDPHRGTALAAVAEVARDARSNEVQEVVARVREMYPL